VLACRQEVAASRGRGIFTAASRARERLIEHVGTAEDRAARRARMYLPRSKDDASCQISRATALTVLSGDRVMHRPARLRQKRGAPDDGK
jgi:hypothetical protein